MRQLAGLRLAGVLKQAQTTPAFTQLSARIGRAQAQRETRWLAEHCFETQTIDDLPKLVTQRAAGSPLQYLIGSVQFCGLKLQCKQPILIPRPETEQIVDWTLHTINNNDTEWKDSIPFQQSYTVHPPALDSFPNPPRSLRVLDLCTGSGNIALSLAAHLADPVVVGVDLNPEAINLSQCNHLNNSSKLSSSTQVSFRQCDVMNEQAVKQLVDKKQFDLIISNPPYIAISEQSSLQTEVVDFEDPRALFAPDAGMAFYSRIISLSPMLLCDQKFRRSHSNLPELILEVGDNEQAEKVRVICQAASFRRVKVLLDWNGTKRWIAAAR